MDGDDEFEHSLESRSTREQPKERQTSMASSASVELLSWNHQQGRAGSVTMVARDLLKTT